MFSIDYLFQSLGEVATIFINLALPRGEKDLIAREIAIEVLGLDKRKSREASCKKPWIQTPLIESFALSKEAGCRIFLKLENLQPAGSFKSRGIGNLIVNAIKASTSSSEPHFYSSSGGNAGLACATTARILGYESTIVVPLSTKPEMIVKLHDAGASSVIQIGISWAEADKHLREEVLVKDPNGIYVPPFDHEDIWEGVSGIVREIYDQLPEGDDVGLDAIVCSVGGGGLFCGIMKGLLDNSHAPSRKLPKVLAMETIGAASLSKSLLAGERITLPGITSIATCLGATRVASQTFAYAYQNPKIVTSIALTDQDALKGCLALADEERILVEAGCGVSIAMCSQERLKDYLPNLSPESKVVVIVCGGSNTSVDMLAEFRKSCQ